MKDPLTPQEQRVIALVAEGKTDNEIAQDLGIARSTVVHYVRSICQKLRSPNRTAAAVQYYRCTGPSSHHKMTGSQEGDESIQ
ncbi:MAG: helix-turn-helix transcriptional regulator [Chloroflexaceae bacterium]|nr:helix-turn-helix transcriptional regulator [Chloroflexaceae bacterium]